MLTNQIQAAFPNVLSEDVQAVISIIPINKIDLTQFERQFHHISVNNEILTLPDRVYFDFPDINLEKALSKIQKTIFYCIYSSHHDGFVRQRSLEKLINQNEYWVTAFTIQRLGDYILEILEVLDRHINDSTIFNYYRLIKENSKNWQLIESRMISYWNEYYRYDMFPKFNEYLGYRLVQRIFNTGR